MGEQKLTGEIFYPSNEVIAKARIRDWESVTSPSGE